MFGPLPLFPTFSARPETPADGVIRAIKVTQSLRRAGIIKGGRQRCPHPGDPPRPPQPPQYPAMPVGEIMKRLFFGTLENFAATAAQTAAQNLVGVWFARKFGEVQVEVEEGAHSPIIMSTPPTNKEWDEWVRPSKGSHRFITTKTGLIFLPLVVSGGRVLGLCLSGAAVEFSRRNVRVLPDDHKEMEIVRKVFGEVWGATYTHDGDVVLSPAMLSEAPDSANDQGDAPLA